MLCYFAFVAALHSHFDRYTLPLVPALGVLAARARPLYPVAAVSLAVPLAWSVQGAVAHTRTDTRVVAQRWIERRLPHGSRVAAESSTPPLPGFRVVPLALPGRGRPRDPNRSLAHLESTGVDYVLVTGAVADRVLAARSFYPYDSRFYDDLRRRARLVYRLDPGGGLSGPWVRVYHVPR